MAKAYKITNYGNTRSVYIKGQAWEISRNGSITTNKKEIADEFEKMLFIDVEVIKRTLVKSSSSEKKKKKASKKKKKVTASMSNKKIKH